MMHEPGTCPKCGSIEADEWKAYWEVDDGIARLHAQCSDCGCEYEDVFTYRDTEWEGDDEN